MLPTDPARDVRRALMIARALNAAVSPRLKRDDGGSVFLPGVGTVRIPSWAYPQHSNIPIQPSAIAPPQPKPYVPPIATPATAPDSSKAPTDPTSGLTPNVNQRYGAGNPGSGIGPSNSAGPSNSIGMSGDAASTVGVTSPASTAPDSASPAPTGPAPANNTPSVTASPVALSPTSITAQNPSVTSAEPSVTAPTPAVTSSPISAPPASSFGLNTTNTDASTYGDTTTSPTTAPAPAPTSTTAPPSGLANAIGSAIGNAIGDAIGLGPPGTNTGVVSPAPTPSATPAPTSASPAPQGKITTSVLGTPPSDPAATASMTAADAAAGLDGDNAGAFGVSGVAAPAPVSASAPTPAVSETAIGPPTAAPAANVSPFGNVSAVGDTSSQSTGVHGIGSDAGAVGNAATNGKSKLAQAFALADAIANVSNPDAAWGDPSVSTNGITSGLGVNGIGSDAAASGDEGVSPTGGTASPEGPDGQGIGSGVSGASSSGGADGVSPEGPTGNGIGSGISGAAAAAAADGEGAAPGIGNGIGTGIGGIGGFGGQNGEAANGYGNGIGAVGPGVGGIGGFGGQDGPAPGDAAPGPSSGGDGEGSGPASGVGGIGPGMGGVGGFGGMNGGFGAAPSSAADGPGVGVGGIGPGVGGIGGFGGMSGPAPGDGGAPGGDGPGGDGPGGGGGGGDGPGGSSGGGGGDGGPGGGAGGGDKRGGFIGHALKVARRHRADGGSADDPTNAINTAKQIIAYHGSPHSFDKFDMSKIGTGEGAQAYGHGLYFAGNEDVAKSYKDAGPASRAQYDDINKRMSQLSKEMDSNSRGYRNFKDKELGARQAAEYDALMEKRSKLGHMYQVAINAHPDHFLDWDKPLSKHPKHVRDAFVNALPPHPVHDEWKKNGAIDHAPVSSLYKGAAGSTNGDVAAGKTAAFTNALRAAGIPGIKYLDAGSRGKGDGSRNYVVFDDNLVNILKKYARGGDIETALRAAHGVHHV